MTDRLRGRLLQARRERMRRDNPLCVECQKAGRVRLWTELDHVVPLFKGGADDESNLQGLCAPCHEAKTARDLGCVRRVAIGADGWPVGGE